MTAPTSQLPMSVGCGVEVGSGGREGLAVGLAVGIGEGLSVGVGVTVMVTVGEGEAVGLDDAVAEGLAGSGDVDDATGSETGDRIRPPISAPTTMAATPTTAAEVHFPAGVASQTLAPV